MESASTAGKDTGVSTGSTSVEATATGVTTGSTAPAGIVISRIHVT
jgi:hypothetical protein